VEVALEVPAGSLRFWGERLEKYQVAIARVEERFGESVLPIVDPHGLRLALVETSVRHRRVFTPWEASAVDADHQIRGLHGARIWERHAGPTTTFLTEVLGFETLGAERGWARYGFSDSAGVVDVLSTPGERRGAWGVGCVHHLAWRVDDDRHQLLMRAQIEAGGARPTPVIDRFWFKSVYFKEPGGVLFEVATDGPGFAIDEDRGHLGETLVLPPWLETERDAIEAALPRVEVREPRPAGVSE
jgi:glyoxalase family protein